MSESESSAALRDYLERLPLPDASNDLFERVERSRRRRRLVRRMAIGSAATLLVVLAIAPFVSRTVPPVDGLARGLTDHAAGTPLTPHSRSRNPAETELRLIDRQLAAAFSATAPEGHIDTLWQRRKAAIQRLEQEPTDERHTISL